MMKVYYLVSVRFILCQNLFQQIWYLFLIVDITIVSVMFIIYCSILLSMISILYTNFSKRKIFCFWLIDLFPVANLRLILHSNILLSLIYIKTFYFVQEGFMLYNIANIFKCTIYNFIWLFKCKLYYFVWRFTCVIYSL